MMTRKAVILILLALTFALLAACSPLKPISVETAETTVQEQTQQDSQSSAVQPKGTVITANRVENPEGGYYIPIPDSWFTKVSYEVVGTETYFYHITHDANELEINPVLLHVGAEENISPDEMGINVFLEIGNLSVYEILRMDAPYNQNSQDSIEYLTLYEDIPQILQSVWLIDDTMWQQQINNFSPFTQYDAYIESHYMGTTSKEETLATIDEMPSDIKELTWGATGEVEEIYKFSFGEISFLDGILASAYLRDGSISGPRGFRVGDNINDVLNAFTLDFELDTEDMTIFYRQNPGDEDFVFVPPSAVLLKEPGSISVLRLECFDEGVDFSGMTVEELKYEYMFTPIYSCNFHFSDDGIISMIIVQYLPSAE